MTCSDKYEDIAFSNTDIPYLVIRTSSEAQPGERSTVAMPPDMIPWKRLMHSILRQRTGHRN